MADVDLSGVNFGPLFGAATRAFWKSIPDMQKVAVDRAPARSGRLRGSVRIDRRGGVAARVSFNTPYAKAREKGAYIEPKRYKYLHFPIGGQWRIPHRAVRQKAQPYLWPAMRLWKSRLFNQRLKQEIG